jgi:hypothetical protein
MFAVFSLSFSLQTALVDMSVITDGVDEVAAEGNLQMSFFQRRYSSKQR